MFDMEKLRVEPCGSEHQYYSTIFLDIRRGSRYDFPSIYYMFADFRENDITYWGLAYPLGSGQSPGECSRTPGRST